MNKIYLNVSCIVFAEKVNQKESSLKRLVSTLRAKPLKQNELELTRHFAFSLIHYCESKDMHGPD